MAYILIMALVVIDAVIFIMLGYLLSKYRKLDHRAAATAVALIMYIVNNSELDPDELPEGIRELVVHFNSV